MSTTVRNQALRRLAVLRLSYKTAVTKTAPPRYRKVAQSSQHCGTCKSYKDGGCNKFGVRVKTGYTCDAYKPDVRKLALKHLQGKHDQSEHYRKSGSGTSQQSSGGSEEDEQAASSSGTPRKGRKPTKHKAALVGKFESTQIKMPPTVAAMVRMFATRIPTADYTGDGLELDSHVTTFYGLHQTTDLKDDIRRIAATTTPSTIGFGAVSAFTDNPDFDVLTVSVDGNILRELNLRIKRLPNGNTRRSYSPHMTIAYLKKGTATQYIGDPFFNGRKVNVSNLILSERGDNDGDDWKQTVYPLLGMGKPRIPFQESDVVKLTTKARERLATVRTETAAPMSFGFGVFKDKRGDDRWVSLSSNAYRDRDREIVSVKSLTEDVEYADKHKEYGPLRFWHMKVQNPKTLETKGVDIGDCDFNMMHGRFLIESGTFRTKEIAQKVAAVASDYQISIGFRHPPDQPDPDGVYHNIRRFERSLVPVGMAANPFTKIIVKEQQIMSDAKVQALKALLGPEAVAELLGGADSAQKSADAMGVSFKDFDWNSVATDPEALLEAAVKNFDEVEAGQTMKMGDGKHGKMGYAKGEKMGDEDEEEEKMDEKKGDEKEDDETVKMLKSIMNRIGGLETRFDEQQAQGQSAEKSVRDSATQALSQASVAQSQQITGLETKVSTLTNQLETAVKELKAANAQPSAFANGHRPTEAKATLVPGADPVIEAEKEAGAQGGYSGLMNFMSPATNGQG